MNFNKKEKIRNIVLVVLSTIILWSAGILILCRIFFVPRCPSEELKKALEFVNSENSIGMSLDECKEIFPELSFRSNNQKASVYVGCFEYGNWEGQPEYTLYIFFDENDKVRFAQLRDNYEWENL